MRALSAFSDAGALRTDILLRGSFGFLFGDGVARFTILETHIWLWSSAMPSLPFDAFPAWLRAQRVPNGAQFRVSPRPFTRCSGDIVRRCCRRCAAGVSRTTSSHARPRGAAPHAVSGARGRVEDGTKGLQGSSPCDYLAFGCRTLLLFCAVCAPCN